MTEIDKIIDGIRGTLKGIENLDIGADPKRALSLAEIISDSAKVLQEEVEEAVGGLRLDELIRLIYYDLQAFRCQGWLTVEDPTKLADAVAENAKEFAHTIDSMHAKREGERERAEGVEK